MGDLPLRELLSPGHLPPDCSWAGFTDQPALPDPRAAATNLTAARGRPQSIRPAVGQTAQVSRPNGRGKRRERYGREEPRAPQPGYRPRVTRSRRLAPSRPSLRAGRTT